MPFKIALLLYGLLLLFLSQGCKKELIVDPPPYLPTLNIEVDHDIPMHRKVAMTLKITAGDGLNSYPARIERRGGFSISFPKHSYEVDLEKDVSLGGLPPDDDWILNANYIDKTFLRHVMAYDLFAEMNERNESPKTQFVEVEINSKYNGLYVLMEKLDKSSLGVNKSSAAGAVFKEPHLFRESYAGIMPKDSSNFHHQTYPKITEDDRTNVVDELRTFILTSTDTAFAKGIASVIDLPNFIDWHLLLLITNNSDGILKNFYLYKIDEATPMRVAPWDYDHSFGRDGDNELNLDERPLDIERSILFLRLLTFDWYKTALKQRWLELNALDLLSEHGLSQRVISKSTTIRDASLKNHDLWPVDGEWYYDASTFDEEIQIMLQFIPIRHQRLANYFESL